MNTIYNICDTNVKNSIYSLYEGILDDVETNLADGDELMEHMKTLSWIAGTSIDKTYRDMPGGIQKNIEALIGKKHPDRTYYMGPIIDRIENQYSNIIVEHSANFKTRMFSWLNAIVMNTKFDKPVINVPRHAIAIQAAKTLLETLNDLRIEGVTDEFDVYILNFGWRALELTLMIKKKLENGSYKKYRLCTLKFDISEEYNK